VKTLLQLAATILLLASALSTSSFADGGNPMPECPPGACTVN